MPRSRCPRTPTPDGAMAGMPRQRGKWSRKEIRERRFREDLYYRLNVFPNRLPPLRERGEDVGLLAESFARRLAQKLERHFEPLGADCVRRLAAHHWPGNVRELENVTERAAIAAQGKKLNLNRAHPEAPPHHRRRTRRETRRSLPACSRSRNSRTSSGTTFFWRSKPPAGAALATTARRNSSP